MKNENYRKLTIRLSQSTGFVMGALALAVLAVSPGVTPPLPRAHAHNDYEHTRPLIDALEFGFCSVEADIWLVNGQLLVAHDLKDAKAGRTLQALYLDPLRARVQQNGGKVFRGGPPFTLLVDVKSDATNTYVALRDALRPYAAMLTTFSNDRTATNAVAVIVSGNRARELMAAETNRLAAYDGRLADLDSSDSPHLVPLISDNWTLHFKWRAQPEQGPLSEPERTRLRHLVDRAHQQGRRLRLWGTPDRPLMWQELFDAGVDLINTDDLAGLERFLLARRQQK